MKTAHLLLALTVSQPAFAQHDMTNMGHRTPSTEETADRTVLRALFDQVSAWPPSERTRLVWADIRDASKAIEAGDHATFAIFASAAKAKLAETPPTAQAPTPEQLLFRASGRYMDMHRQARIALDTLPGDTKPKKSYTVAANTKAAIALVRRLRTGGTASPAEISQAIAAFDRATTILAALVRSPYK